MKLNLLLLLIIFFSKFSFAAEKTVDPNLIHKNLRCLVCQGQSISDSNSDFAQTIKLVVKDLIDEGKTEDEIYASPCSACAWPNVMTVNNKLISSLNFI